MAHLGEIIDMLEANIMMESLGEKPTKANKLKPF
jgi:hypothetical protein